MTFSLSRFQLRFWSLLGLLALAVIQTGCQTDSAARADVAADGSTESSAATVIEGTTADGESPRPEIGVSTDGGVLRLELAGLRATDDEIVTTDDGVARLRFESEASAGQYDGVIAAHGDAPRAGYVVFRQHTNHIVEARVHAPGPMTSSLEEEASTLIWRLAPDSEASDDRAALEPSDERGVLEPMWADDVPGIGGAPLTIVVRRVKLADILELFSAKYDIPIITGVDTSPFAERPTSLDLHDVSFERAFRILLDAHDLGYFADGERLRVVRREQIQHEREMLAHIPVLSDALEPSPTRKSWDPAWETSSVWVDDFIQTGPSFFVWGKAYSSGDISEFLRRMESLDSVMVTGLEKVTKLTDDDASPMVLKFKALGRFHLEPPAGTE